MLCKWQHREKSSTFHSILPAFQLSVSSLDDNQYLSCYCKLTLTVLEVMTESKCSRQPKPTITEREIVQDMSCSAGLRQRRECRGAGSQHTQHCSVSEWLLSAQRCNSSLLLLSREGTGHVCEETRPQFHDSLRSMETPCSQSGLSMYFVWLGVIAALVVLTRTLIRRRNRMCISKLLLHGSISCFYKHKCWMELFEIQCF